jgi:hypothetical protein
MNKNKLFNVFALLIIATTVLSACGPRAVSTAFCVAEITYNGEVIDDGIAWPGQPVRELVFDGSSRLYIPCGYRNYVIDDGKKANPNGTVLGDRKEPIKLSLPSGKLVDVYASAYWTLNQGRAEIKEFIKFQKKYNALATDMSGADNVYSSTPGWNDMLLENFSPTMDAIARQAVQNVINNPPLREDGSPILINDNFWKQDTEQWNAVANEMSNLFKDNIAKRVGSGGLNLFCGSNSDTGWQDPTIANAGKPENKFNCAPVIIEVTYVEPSSDQVETGSQSIVDSNQQRYDAAEELYGDQTSCWLGILDAIRACGETPNCTVILESNQCQNPDGSDAGGTIILLPSDPTPALAEPTITPAP